MAFRFRYESLLNYRRHLKEMAQVELAKSMEQLQVAKEALQHLTTEYARTTGALGQGLRSGIAAQRLKNYSEYLSRLKEDISQKALQVAEWEEVVEKRRKALLEKDKEWKIMDKLKERDLRKWTAEREAKERLELNETAILRHGREFQ